MEKKTMSTFGEAVTVYKRDFFYFSGQATRSEYWWGMLYLFLLNMATLLICTIISIVLNAIMPGLGIIPMLVLVVIEFSYLISFFAAIFRRYRNVGISGFSTFICYALLITVFLYTGEWYYIETSFGTVRAGIVNNNLLFLLMELVLFACFFLPSDLLAVKNNNKFIHLFIRKK